MRQSSCPDLAPNDLIIRFLTPERSTAVSTSSAHSVETVELLDSGDPTMSPVPTSVKTDAGCTEDSDAMTSETCECKEAKSNSTQSNLKNNALIMPRAYRQLTRTVGQYAVGKPSKEDIVGNATTNNTRQRNSSSVKQDARMLNVEMQGQLGGRARSSTLSPKSQTRSSKIDVGACHPLSPKSRTRDSRIGTLEVGACPSIPEVPQTRTYSRGNRNVEGAMMDRVHHLPAHFGTRSDQRWAASLRTPPKDRPRWDGRVSCPSSFDGFCKN